MSLKTETQTQETCLIKGALMGISMFYLSTISVVGLVLWQVIVA